MEMTRGQDMKGDPRLPAWIPIAGEVVVVIATVAHVSIVDRLFHRFGLIGAAWQWIGSYKRPKDSNNAMLPNQNKQLLRKS